MLSLVLSTPAGAAKADRARPLIVDAGDGQMAGDRTPGRVEIKGPVVLTKGSLLMRAGGVVATAQSEGYHVVASAGAGGAVSFVMDLDTPGARMQAQAEQVEYEEASGIARFTGNARLRRLVGGQVEREFSGQSIVFDTVSEAIQADGKPRGQVAGEGGLRIILMPRTQAASAAPPSPAVPLQTVPALTPKPPSR